MILFIVFLVFGFLSFLFGNFKAGIFLILIGFGIYIIGSYMFASVSVVGEGISSFWNSITSYFTGGNYLGPYTSKVISAFNNFYQNLMNVMNIISNPQGYILQSEIEAAPNQQSENTGYSIQPSNSGELIILSNGIGSPINQFFSFNFQLPQNYQGSIPIYFSCEYTYVQNCMNLSSINPSPSFTTINISNDIPLIIACSSSSENFSECNYKSGIVLGVELTALLSNITTLTQYNFLVVSENLLIDAEEKGENIYQLLDLNPSEFDKGYYEGISGLPVLDIYRVGAISGYPLIVNGDNISYDVILLNIYPLTSSNSVIDSINNLTLYIYYESNQINFEFLNFNNGQAICNKFSTYNSQISLYNYTCESYPTNNFAECMFSFNNQYLQGYEENSNGNYLYITIPICISANTDFNGYSEVSVYGILNYNYNIISSTIEDYVYVGNS